MPKRLEGCRIAQPEPSLFMNGITPQLTGISFYSCDRESLICSPDFREWLNRVGCNIATRVGVWPRTRMHAYERSGTTQIALHVFSQQTGVNIAITIAVVPDEAYLTSLVDDRLDIKLPSFVCALDFVSGLVNLTQGFPQSSPHIEIHGWRKQPATSPKPVVARATA